MATVIRMTRKGKRNQPFYNIVVADQDHPRDGKYTERIGYYNPLVETGGFKIQWERYQHWLKQGAKPSDLVRTLVKNNPQA